jgi:hypothetical protein
MMAVLAIARTIIGARTRYRGARCGIVIVGVRDFVEVWV